jgi:ATP-binding cassette subfamily F protein uup
MAPPLLSLTDIVLSLGSARLLDGASIAVGTGDRICLVGRNGSGKSTLLKAAAGLIATDGGVRFVQPGATVRYLPQEPDLGGFATVLEYVEAGLGPGDDHYRGVALLDALGLTGAEDPANLSGGETRRAAIARALAPSPDLLLLDEPTNHLDLPAIEWLEAELAAMRSGLVLISHDRRLLERVAKSVVWLDGGLTRRMDRGFEHFETWREEVVEAEERERHKLGRQILREEDWMRYGVTARRKRNVRRVAELAALRSKKKEIAASTLTLNLQSQDAGVSGKLVVVAEGVGKSWPTAEGPPKHVVRGLELRVIRQDRLGIVGANGAGKSTLLGLLTGEIEPEAGKIAIGASLERATLDQQRAALDPTISLAETLTGGSDDMVSIGGERRHVIGVLKDFLFRPEQARTPVGTLSGGERGRLALACALIRPSNLLILDEPTNDLDLETLDLLEDMIADYRGTVMVVSHDRDFLDRVSTSLLVAEGEGRWIEYAGGWSDMLAQRGGSPFAPAGMAPAPSRDTGPAREKRAPTPAKMSFKDTHALKTLPATIEALNRKITTLSEQLADGNLYRRDPTQFDKLTKSLSEATSKREAAEEQWLELEMRREAAG